MRVVSIVCLLVCAACVTTGSGAGGPAQTVADVDRALHSAITLSDSARAGLLEHQGQAIDAWLSEQLQALGTSSTDEALSQVQQIIAEADRRGRPALAAGAERVEARMLEQRTPELDAMIAKGQWLEALELVSRLTAHSRPSSAGPALKGRVFSDVKQKVVQAEATAATGPERFLYARMHAWVGEPVTPGPAVDQLSHLTTTNPTLDWSGSSCSEAQSITLASSASGTTAAVHVTLGGCEVARRTSSELRNIATTGTTALGPEHRPQQRLPQGGHRSHAPSHETLRQANRRRGLALSVLRRIHRADQHQPRYGPHWSKSSAESSRM